jgi:hypothetical protein
MLLIHTVTDLYSNLLYLSMDAEQQKKLMDQILELRQKVRMYATEHVHKCSDDNECLR